MPVGGDRQGEDKIQYNYRMNTKPLTFLLALTFLFLFSGSSVVVADDYQDADDAYERGDYKKQHPRLFCR